MGVVAMHVRADTPNILPSEVPLGVSWLIAWSAGALVAWLIPWAPLDSSWALSVRWPVDHLATFVRGIARLSAGTYPVIALLSLLALCLGVIRFNQKYAHSRSRYGRRSIWRGLILTLSVLGGMWWSLANMGEFVRSMPAGFESPITCSMTVGLADLPKPGDRMQRLLGQIRTVSADSEDSTCQQFKVGQRLIIRDYARHPPAYAGGQIWQFTLRLKPPHGSLNPGGFDYERWLFAQRIVATASARGTPTLLASTGTGFALRLAALRAELRTDMLNVSDSGRPDDPGRGLLLGLTIGDGDFLSQADWNVLLATGTNHLLAISGLHVGMVAGLFAWLVGGLWARTRWCEAIPARRIAAFVAVVAAWGYALLAGMSVPTERTALMISILLAGVLLGRAWRLLDLWLVALLGVLLLDPFSPLTAGFWLSFGAVLVMLLWLQYRPTLSFWRDALRLQVVLTLALLPLVWLMFDRVAWSSLPANLLAVPLITLLITPLALLTALFSVWAPAIAHLLMIPVDWLAQGLFVALRTLARLAPDSQVVAPPGWAILLAGLGVAWMLMPRSWPRRYLGLVLCVPAMIYRPPAVPPELADIWLLDVGQGLAVILKTAHHAALYDTGPAYLTSDAGSRTVIPALRALGVTRLDQIVISHHARDHAGGLRSVLTAFPNTPVISGEPLAGVPTEACRDGSRWTWDGVLFELFQAENMRSDNNHSCVLRVTDHQGSLLLTGDIEKRAEHDLIARHKLAADWLYVPHHGSKTSSTPAFLAAVHPRSALVSAGRFNQFHHPNPTILARYRRADIPVINTADVGAIHLVNGVLSGYRTRVWPFVWRR
jgi:competence protein ComEC